MLLIPSPSVYIIYNGTNNLTILCVCCTQGTKSKSNSSVHAWAQKEKGKKGSLSCLHWISLTLDTVPKASAFLVTVKVCQDTLGHGSVFFKPGKAVCQSSTLDQLTYLCQVHEGETRDLPNCTSLTHS